MQKKRLTSAVPQQSLIPLLLFSLGVGCLLLLVVPFFREESVAQAATSIAGLHVQGNQIMNGSGQSLRLLGVSRPGTEYKCVQGGGIFDGPSDAASVQAMISWKVNAVRVPLNEDCWLGINGANPSGATYQQAIVNYVNLLNSNGLVAILDLHWNAPGATLATKQQPMADSDHALTFWSQVANTFKNNSSVILELYNEPQNIGWSCWKNGGNCGSVSFPVAGMQQMVSAVRATGAMNILALGGLFWSNDLSGWLANKPSDPLNNLVAAWHVYNNTACNSTSCWDSQVAPVAQQVPVIATEIGEYDCAHSFIDSVMSWLDSKQQSYLGWAWVVSGCGGFPSLITDYSGTPSNFGIGLKNHLASVGQLLLPAPSSPPISSFPYASPSYACMGGVNCVPSVTPTPPSAPVSSPSAPSTPIVLPSSVPSQGVSLPSTVPHPNTGMATGLLALLLSIMQLLLQLLRVLL